MLPVSGCIWAAMLTQSLWDPTTICCKRDHVSRLLPVDSVARWCQYQLLNLLTNTNMRCPTGWLGSGYTYPKRRLWQYGGRVFALEIDIKVYISRACMR